MAKALRNNHPYAIEVLDGEMRFARTDRSRAGLFALIAAGLAAMMVINGVVQMVLTHLAAGAVLLGLGTLFVLVAILVFKKRRPPTTTTLTLSKGTLRDGETAIAAASEIRPQVQIDWTDGMGGLRFARVVSLRWKHGRLPIFKTYDKREVGEIQRYLADHGIQ
ncbi:MAG: hypothetical protein ACKV2T_06985 [Kofleriaceae bacterium]